MSHDATRNLAGTPLTPWTRSPCAGLLRAGLLCAMAGLVACTPSEEDLSDAAGPGSSDAVAGDIDDTADAVGPGDVAAEDTPSDAGARDTILEPDADTEDVDTAVSDGDAEDADHMDASDVETDTGDVDTGEPDTLELDTEVPDDAANDDANSPEDVGEIEPDAPTEDAPPITPECGNGVIEHGEECDDANALNTDACRNGCTLPYCGDRMVDRGEQCDDGNDSAADHCIDCRVVLCGDGIVDVVEGCDDGNSDPSDGCDYCDLVVCGDGEVDWGEECDDGNDDDTDGCRHCRLPVCGDGFVDATEECDDGNEDDTDGCRSCRLPACGDGFVDATEECDDVNEDQRDGCRRCRLPHCGDRVVDAEEECDEGADNGTDGNRCSTSCELPYCGDGRVDEREECDDVNDIDDDDCTTFCQLPRCGDGIRTAGEVCDFGRASAETNCMGPCEIGVCGDGDVGLSEVVVTIRNPYGSASIPRDWVGQGYCGCGLSCLAKDQLLPENGVCRALGFERVVDYQYNRVGGYSARRVDQWLCSERDCSFSSSWARSATILTEITCAGLAIEQCDDGEHNGLDPNACRNGCLLPSCLDGVLDAGEECDDGNLINTDGCGRDCRASICGNGRVEAPEECDDGNDVSGDACQAGCVLPQCGDGVLDAGELCDDGNTYSRDACDSDCTPTRCGDGIVQRDEECDDGTENSDTEVRACRTNCRLWSCGDGVVDSAPPGTPGGRQGDYEQCDDQNDIDEDGCANNCWLSTCGNGVLDPGEVCDNPTDEWRYDTWAGGWEPGCYPGCFGSYCGDGHLDREEQCETPEFDGCGGSCLWWGGFPPIDEPEECESPRCCGNGVVDIYEDCEPNGLTDLMCSQECIFDLCGDGFVQPGVPTPWRRWSLETCTDNPPATGWADVGSDELGIFYREVQSNDAAALQALWFELPTRWEYHRQVEYDVSFEYRFPNSLSRDRLNAFDTSFSPVTDWTEESVRVMVTDGFEFSASWFAVARDGPGVVQVRNVIARAVPGQGEQCDLGWSANRDDNGCTPDCFLDMP
jgi:cysteine-rich repeat protein